MYPDVYEKRSSVLEELQKKKPLQNRMFIKNLRI